MLRTAVGQFQGQSPGDWNNGAALKYVQSSSEPSFGVRLQSFTNIPPPSSDLNLDISARHTCQDYYGYDTWVAGHRNGQSGLENPGTADIQSKCRAIDELLCFV